MSNQVEWCKPSGCVEKNDMGAGEIIVTKTRIYFANDIADCIETGRIAIGTSKERAVIFIKGDEGGYRVRRGKRYSFVELGGAAYRGVYWITQGQRVRKVAVKQTDGSFALFV